jgi:hypothetical protein
MYVKVVKVYEFIGTLDIWFAEQENSISYN